MVDSLDDKDEFANEAEGWAANWLEAAHIWIRDWQQGIHDRKFLAHLFKDQSPYLDRALRIVGALPYSCFRPIGPECDVHIFKKGEQG